MGALHFGGVWRGLAGHYCQQGALGKGATGQILLQPGDADHVRAKPAAAKYLTAPAFPKEDSLFAEGELPCLCL